MKAKVLQTNLWKSMPYAQPYFGGVVSGFHFTDKETNILACESVQWSRSLQRWFQVQETFLVFRTRVIHHNIFSPANSWLKATSNFVLHREPGSRNADTDLKSCSLRSGVKTFLHALITLHKPNIFATHNWLRFLHREKKMSSWWQKGDPFKDVWWTRTRMLRAYCSEFSFPCGEILVRSLVNCKLWLRFPHFFLHSCRPRGNAWLLFRGL